MLVLELELICEFELTFEVVVELELAFKLAFELALEIGLVIESALRCRISAYVVFGSFTGIVAGAVCGIGKSKVCMDTCG